MSTADLQHDLLGQKSLFGRYSTSAAPSTSFRWLLWKSAFDWGLALLLLIPALPLIGLLIIAVRLTSRGPGLYRQVRVGRGCRRFLMYKLRTMCVDAEAHTGPVWSAIAADPRITALGYWLRRLHLDELPQLFNVLKGEMSLVGPRPDRPEFVALLADEIPGYMDRLQVRPGITGLAQVNLPPDTDLDSVRRKLVLDREYLATMSFGLDLRLLLCTAMRVFGVRGGHAVGWFGLARTVALPPSTQLINACSNRLTTPRAVCAAPRGHTHSGAGEPAEPNDAPSPGSRAGSDRTVVCSD
jgi:lipopolysaccharide/colanic/teichoic acid biosynthesis glycosyltransferase